jgi:hypothetical protein
VSKARLPITFVTRAVGLQSAHFFRLPLMLQGASEKLNVLPIAMWLHHDYNPASRFFPTAARVPFALQAPTRRARLQYGFSSTRQMRRDREISGAERRIARNKGSPS